MGRLCFMCNCIGVTLAGFIGPKHSLCFSKVEIRFSFKCFGTAPLLTCVRRLSSMLLTSKASKRGGKFWNPKNGIRSSFILEMSWSISVLIINRNSFRVL